MVEALGQAFQSAVQRARRQGVADEGRHRRLGDLGVAAAGTCRVGGQGGPGLRHVEAAVRRDAAQQGVAEAGGSGVAARRDVAIRGGRHIGVVSSRDPAVRHDCFAHAKGIFAQ